MPLKVLLKGASIKIAFTKDASLRKMYPYETLLKGAFTKGASSKGASLADAFSAEMRSLTSKRQLYSRLLTKTSILVENSGSK